MFIGFSQLFCIVDPDYYMAFVPFCCSDPGRLYNHVLRFKSWPLVVWFKKHRAVAHCRDVPKDQVTFRNTWKGVSGIYKITFLPFRLFTYYGSSRDQGGRFKYHYFTSPKLMNFLGLFLNVFGWSNFSITVVELCPVEQLEIRENWYLTTFCPLLNVATEANNDPRRGGPASNLTRSKISASLMGRKDSLETRAKKSETRKGAQNPFFGIGPGIKALDIAAAKAGNEVYVYTVDFILVAGAPFRSHRLTSDTMKIGRNTISTYIDTGLLFKGHYYYSSPQSHLSIFFRLQMVLNRS